MSTQTMRLFRFFCDHPAGDSVLLDPIQSRHLNKVLRLKVGDEVQIFDGKGLLADAQIETITREG
ncbi:MAG TPA: 16S rRNA (uracil(1498)-N(3))-methyltransferase, partial [Phycisphaerales bacterium]|nr:16S rRNA (uracil(1498)-N(3))-methyltransferase [Phycisphaerales bacterium]